VKEKKINIIINIIILYSLQKHKIFAIFEKGGNNSKNLEQSKSNFLGL